MYSTGLYLIALEQLWPRNWRGQVSLYIYYGIVCDTNRIAYVLKLRQKNSLQLLLVVTIFGNEIFVRCLDAFQKEVSMNIGWKCELA